MSYKAVIIAAGLGSRLLPYTRVIPKELLPIQTPAGILRPALDLIIDELVEAGVREVLIVTSPRKAAIRAWFTAEPALEDALRSSPARLKHAQVRQDVQVHFVDQHQPLGTGHAIALAADFAGNDPIVVVFPDDLFAGGHNPTATLLEVHRRTNGAVLGAIDIGDNDPSAYGMLDAITRNDGEIAVQRVVEKPTRDEAPSTLASVGRFLYTPSLLARLAQASPDPRAGGEITPMAALQAHGQANELFAALLDARRFDLGHVEGWCKANAYMRQGEVT